MLKRELITELEEMLHLLRELEHEPESIQEEQRDEVRNRLRKLLHNIETHLDEEGTDDEWIKYFDLLYRAATAAGAIAKTTETIVEVLQLLK